jgi:TrmH family RNA methyltransferase
MPFLKELKFEFQKYTISMVSKNQIKLITGLHQKKFRHAGGLFIAEGLKVIRELIAAGLRMEHLFVTETLSAEFDAAGKELVTEAELKKISALTTPSGCLAVFAMPEPKPVAETGLIIALDDIRDPGNLGTIIRLCDWFGITELVCSGETADIYNPKVVQATMGSIARVNVTYTNLSDFLAGTKLPIFGTFMDGKNIYGETLPRSGVIVFGNEANGISAAVEKLAANRIAIPRFGDLQKTESLNVATAAAIILSEFRRSGQVK